MLKTTNIWPGEQKQEGATILANQIMAPKEVANDVVISFRAAMLNMTSLDWDSMWDLIDQRFKGDPYFKVHGFNIDDVKKASQHLRRVFPSSWVKARYKAALTASEEVSMGDEFPQEGDSWFPAYHLARTALGAICIDPGWNYLVEIGLSINDLKDFDGTDRLIKQLSRSPGTQHHLCLAAELYQKKYLIGLEPETGAGSSSNDLLVSIHGREYAIEVKEFSSDSPARQLTKEINKKVKNMPNKPTQPVIFHTVISERFDKDKVDLFFEAFDEISAKIPPQISAIIGGSRVIDSTGGRVKRDSVKRVLNPKASLKCNDDDLVTLFEPNCDQIKYPTFGIGELFYFGIKKSDNESVL